METSENWKAAVDLYVRPPEIDILQEPREVFLREDFLLSFHTKIDKYLEEVLLTPATASCFTNAAEYCRKVRARMNKHVCDRFFSHSENNCVYNTLLPTLNILQQRAHAEVEDAVHTAVRDLLPAELVDLILEHALAAE